MTLKGLYVRFQLVWLVCLLVLVSCGSGSNGQDSKNLSRSSTELSYDPTALVNKGQPITITFWTQIDMEEIFRSLCDDYMKIHPNVTIDLISASYKDHFSKLSIALQSGIGPDMFHMHNSFSDKLIPHMEPYPEDIFPSAALINEFRQVAAHVIDGKIYFIDTGIMTSAIFYNKRMWLDAGLSDRDIPRTWEQLRAVARKLTLTDGTGRILRAGFNPNGLGAQLFTALNLQQGQSLFDSKTGRQPIIDTAISRRSLAWIKGLYDQGIVDIKFPEAHESFGLQKAAMIYAWGWTNNWEHSNYPSLEFGLFPLPSWDGNLPPAWDRNNGESSPGVSRYAREDRRAVAFDLIKFFLTRNEYLHRISSSFGVVPAKLTLEKADIADSGGNLQAFRTIMDRTIWPGPLPSGWEDTLSSELIDAVVIDKQSPELCLRRTQASLDELFATDTFQSVENRYPHASELGFAANPAENTK